MATPAISRSRMHVELGTQATQLDLLSSIWSHPPLQREEQGTFALSFSPQLVRHLIHTYSAPCDTVLDCFLGSGTTVIEAQMLGRHSVGIDCNEDLLQFAQQRLLLEDKLPALFVGDARSMTHLLPDESIDLIVTQPPYGGTIRFSKNHPLDLSLLSSHDYLLSIEQVANELYRVLKPDGICALLVGDIKDRGRMVPLGFQFIHRFLSRGFSVKEICDSRTPSTHLPVSILPHEYLLIFQKKQQKTPKRPRMGY